MTLTVHTIDTNMEENRKDLILGVDLDAIRDILEADKEMESGFSKAVEEVRLKHRINWLYFQKLCQTS